MAMVSANGSVKATPSLTFSGVGYYRWFQQKHADGNIADAVACSDGVHLCWDDDDFGNDGVRDQREIRSCLGREIRYVARPFYSRLDKK